MGGWKRAKPAAAEPGGFKALSATVKTITPDPLAIVKNRTVVHRQPVLKSGSRAPRCPIPFRNSHAGVADCGIGPFCPRKGYQPYETEQIG